MPRFARPLVIALCLLASVVVMADYVHWRRNRDDLLQVLEETRVARLNPLASRQIRTELSPHHAKALAARALVFQAMESKSAEDGVEPLALEEKLVALEASERLASEALAAQPNSSQAAMLLGAARYLRWSLTQNRRLIEEASAWEDPLLVAVETSDGKAEPKRFLAAAYLETWWALAPPKKDRAKKLLSALFEQDEASFDLLTPRWLQVARTQDEAFSIIPPTPFAWIHLRLHFATQKNWRSVATTQLRYLEVLGDYLDHQVARAEEQITLGEIEGGRTTCLEVLTNTPPQTRFGPQIQRALELYPPGLHGLTSTDRLKDWLHFILRLDLLGIEFLTPKAINRLNDILGDADPPLRLHAALLGEDEFRIREGQAKIQSTLPWASFFLARARRLLEAGDPQRAAIVLEGIDGLSKLEMPYADLRHAIAQAHASPLEVARARQELSKFRQRRWESFEWRREPRSFFLSLLPNGAAEGLRIEIDDAPPQGSAIEILWDGDLVEVLAVRKGGRYTLRTSIEPRQHLLEIRHLGEQVLPGTVELL